MATQLAGQQDAPAQPKRPNGLSESETRYMRGDRQAHAASVPVSTSRFLNSPLFVHAFTRMALRRHGTDVATTYDIPDMSRGIADVIDMTDGIEGLEEEKARNPTLRAFLERRPQTIYDPAEMEHYAAGTLGAAIRDFIRDSGYDMNFVNKNDPARHDLEYLRKRFGDCHDIQHLVTGFGPNSAGENALAFMNIAGASKHFNPRFAQFFSLPNLFVTAASYSRISFNYPEGMNIQLEAMQRGITAGRALKVPLMLVVWEDYLDWQLDDIATDLGFERGPGEAWKVSEELCRG